LVYYFSDAKFQGCNLLFLATAKPSTNEVSTSPLCRDELDIWEHLPHLVSNLIPLIITDPMNGSALVKVYFVISTESMLPDMGMIFTKWPVPGGERRSD
jgi:hypothetical protein